MEIIIRDPDYQRYTTSIYITHKVKKLYSLPGLQGYWVQTDSLEFSCHNKNVIVGGPKRTSDLNDPLIDI